MSQEKKGYEMKDGDISVFVNDKKGVETRPDYSGKVRIGGVEYRVSLWKTTSASGMKFLSGKAQAPQGEEAAKANDDFEL